MKLAKPIFDKSKTAFEKILTISISLYIVAALIGCNRNLDIVVYATFGTYAILGLIVFLNPKILFDVLRKENEEYLVRNQKKIPMIKAGLRFGGFFLFAMGIALTYIFIVIY